MQSMTGFSRISKSVASLGEIEILIRSFNGRFLETRVHLPKELLALDPMIREKTAKMIHRGTVDITLSLVTKNRAVVFDLESAREFLESARKLGSSLKLKFDLELSDLMAHTDQFLAVGRAQIGEKDLTKILGFVETGLEQLLAERSREGRALKQELSSLLDQLGKIAGQLEDMRSEINERLQSKLRDRMSKVMAAWHAQGEEGVDESRLAQELALLVEKADIREEIVRLAEHLRNYRALLTSKDQVGKKLDFYCQELLREVNTIGSKSADSGLTQLVVNAKSLIEKLREQVQNIE